MAIETGNNSSNNDFEELGNVEQRYTCALGGDSDSGINTNKVPTAENCQNKEIDKAMDTNILMLSLFSGLNEQLAEQNKKQEKRFDEQAKQQKKINFRKKCLRNDINRKNEGMENLI